MEQIASAGKAVSGLGGRPCREPWRELPHGSGAVAGSRCDDTGWPHPASCDQARRSLHRSFAEDGLGASRRGGQRERTEPRLAGGRSVKGGVCPESEFERTERTGLSAEVEGGMSY